MPRHALEWSDFQTDVLQDLYINCELPQRNVANCFGVDVRTLRKQLKKMSILRSLSEATKLAWKNGVKKYNSSSVVSGKDWVGWNGGRVKHDGYILVYYPYHPLIKSGKYILEHRLVWFTAHPNTPSTYIIHHLNGVRDDNRLENLVALPRKNHSTWTLLKTYQKRIRELESKLKNEANQNSKTLRLG